MQSDREFFEDFVRRNTARAVMYCRSRLGVQDPDDIVQDVMVRLYGHVEQLRTFPNPLPYLYRALKNAAIDRARAAKQVRELDFDVAAQPPAEPTERADESGANRSKLAKALANLPADQSEVLRLRYFDELGVTEIAEMLGTSSAAAAMRLARARARLKSELAKAGVRSLD